MHDMFGYEKPPAQTFGEIMVNGINKNNRHPDDFYPTEPEATHALMAVIAEDIEAWSVMNAQPVQFHEPSCGDGAISKVLESYGYDVFSTDLVDRGYGFGGIDYLTCRTTRPFVISNPPFKLAEAFVRKALVDGAERIWMLLKSTHFHASGRTDLFENTPLSRVYPLSWRLDFTGQGSPTMECCWFEWKSGWRGEPMYGPVLQKPQLKINSEKCQSTVDLFGE